MTPLIELYLGWCHLASLPCILLPIAAALMVSALACRMWLMMWRAWWLTR